jgi:hypothetical protein
MSPRHAPIGAGTRSRPQRGVAALALTMILFFAMVLGIGFVNRNLVFEQRASANQYRSTQAFEAAEAGLEWALAQLDRGQRIGADCLPTTNPAATSFRSRYLSWNAATAGFAARTWLDAGVPAPLQPTCVRTAAGWSCSCPANGAPSLSTPSTTGPAPAFTVQFASASQPGLVRVVATGCTSLDGACAPASGARADATARVQVLIGLVPALRTAPAAALTVRGAVGADAGGLGVHNRYAASGGLALHAGGSIGALPARTTVPAGASFASAWVDHDTALAALPVGRFFATYFGLDRAGWAGSPVARQPICSGDCTSALLAAIAGDDGPSLIHIEGDASIVGPVTLGTPARPVAIVASGSLQLVGPVTVNGLLYAGDVAWSGASAAGALVRGAVISAGDYRGDGTPDIDYDHDALARLKGEAGVFVRVNGSWKDF